VTQTLGSMADRGWMIVLSCIRCGHSAETDPASLIPRFGRKQTLIEDMRLYRVFRCSKCDSRVFSIGSKYV
jgi:DNA-directed RNA polymerase subunit RPC12/RpoP